MLSVGMKEKSEGKVHFKEMNGTAVREMLRFVYKGKLELDYLDGADLCQLYRAAHM